MEHLMISAQGLGKRYRIGEREPYIALRDVLTTMMNPARWFKQKKHGEFWALSDVSFDIQKGDVVGLIGKNGAGKSTLLKVLSRITPPTTGSITLHGRVASLLEVGTGFHPELTGRENIFLNGAILGMTKSEIKRKFDEIVAFAEIEQFLDTPVKHYSSGMYVRLAFAVAAHLEPEILVVDEVLAVGDTQFQKKCLQKMGEFGKSGRTVIFVSHNMAAIQTLCTKAMYLDSGRLVGIGPVHDQIETYLKQAHLQAQVTADIQLDSTIRLQKCLISPAAVESGKECSFEVEVISSANATLEGFALLFFSQLNVKTALIDMRTDQPYHLRAGQTLRITGKIKHIPLVEGDYNAAIYIKNGQGFENHVFDVATLSILSKEQPNGLVPYPAAARGIVELDYHLSASIQSSLS